MGPLDCLPSRVLGDAVFRLFRRMPPDGCGKEENLGAAHGGEPGRLGIPLIPADQDADLRVARLPGPKAKIAGSEVKLLVKEGIVRDVHLAVFPQQRPIGVDDRRSVVIEPRRPLLKQRSHDHDLPLPGKLLQGLGRRSRNALGQAEIDMILALAEILRTEELLGADDPGALIGRLSGGGQCLSQILLRVGRTRSLYQSQADLGGTGFPAHHSPSLEFTIECRSARSINIVPPLAS